MLGNHQAYNYKIQLVPHHLKHPPKFSHMVCNQKWDVGPNKELFKEEIIQGQIEICLPSNIL